MPKSVRPIPLEDPHSPRLHAEILREEAQEAVAQMRALGFRIELRRGDLLVFTIEHTVIDHRAGETLERVWPRWCECVIE